MPVVIFLLNLQTLIAKIARLAAIAKIAKVAAIDKIAETGKIA